MQPISGVGDIVEKEVSGVPEPPKIKKKKPLSQWKARRSRVVLDPEAPSSGQQPQSENVQTKILASTSKTPKKVNEAPLSEQEKIHLQNIRQIQKMTPQEIEQEREQIFKTMDPSVLQSLLRRAELKEENSSPHFTEPKQTNIIDGTKTPAHGTLVEWFPGEEPQMKAESPQHSSKHVFFDDSIQEAPNDNITQDKEEALPSTVHFPPAPEELRKYFPDLPVETEKLAWMQPISESEENEYHEEMTSVAPSELRFDFNGNLITPRLSREISQSVGLHHHGDAPSAAGYTIPELAHLCRSSHPAQRSIAIQTIGRVLHKLRLRKYAKSSDLQEGLEAIVRETRIIDTLTEFSDERTRSLTVRTLAVEALWLARTDNSQQIKNTDTN